MGHRTRDRSEFRNSFVGEADSFPYSWFLIQPKQVPLADSYKQKLPSWHAGFSLAWLATVANAVGPRPTLRLGLDLVLDMTLFRCAGM